MASPGGSARGTHPTVQTRYLVGSVVLIAVSFVAIGIAAAAVALGQKLPEIVLTLLLLFGVVVLLGSIGALLVLLAGFGIIDPKEALGLPSGSVRAIIALTLILIFAIVSVFLFWNSGHNVYESTGLTAEQIGLLPRNQVVSIVATGTTYTVQTADTEFANQLALQLMTVLGTLVTAVAAFYFGAKSVAAGAELAKKAAGTTVDTTRTTVDDSGTTVDTSRSTGGTTTTATSTTPESGGSTTTTGTSTDGTVTTDATDTAGCTTPDQ